MRRRLPLDHHEQRRRHRLHGQRQRRHGEGNFHRQAQLHGNGRGGVRHPCASAHHRRGREEQNLRHWRPAADLHCDGPRCRRRHFRRADPRRGQCRRHLRHPPGDADRRRQLRHRLHRGQLHDQSRDNPIRSRRVVWHLWRPGLWHRRGHRDACERRHDPVLHV